MRDRISALLFMSLGIFFLVGALRMPRVTEYGKYGAPGIVPAFFSIMVILLCFIMLVRKHESTSDTRSVPDEIRRKENRKLILASVMFLVYVFLLGKINFLILTSVFLSATSMVFLRKRFVLIALTSVGTTLGIYYLFSRVFLLPLP
ncbi:tripartite tricarboxylate transporter TctB family protein [Thermotoga caldifontis]|uniref:tripartite tricarboxylate transporter TctB family protein n=1 Tax=Thermotoga caldifontis TaxID=1508419 RepID=UPI000596B825|nr:tripartite tricarboxylate transporter TctB family protein [Thermotoga caldifontis]